MFDLDIIDKIDKYEVNNLEECCSSALNLEKKIIFLIGSL